MVRTYSSLGYWSLVSNHKELISQKKVNGSTKEESAEDNFDTNTLEIFETFSEESDDLLGRK